MSNVEGYEPDDLDKLMDKGPRSEIADAMELTGKERYDFLSAMNSEAVAHYRDHDFARDTHKYLNNPESFLYAWRWLNSHPAFNSDPYVASFSSELYMAVYEDEESGEVSIGLEIGAHYSHRDLLQSNKQWVKDQIAWGHSKKGLDFHDVDLDVYAPTFEEAIVQLAGKVHERYGVERPPL